MSCDTQEARSPDEAEDSQQLEEGQIVMYLLTPPDEGHGVIHECNQHRAALQVEGHDDHMLAQIKCECVTGLSPH